jgi:hypothetical protein
LIRVAGRLKLPGSVAAILAAAGLALVIAAGAGLVDTLRHERRAIGSGTAFERFVDTDCVARRTAGCSKAPGAHVHVDRADQIVKVRSPGLYELVGPGVRRVPVTLEIDTFTRRISDVHAGGRTIVTYDSSMTGLLIIVPLILLGLAALAFSAVPLGRATARRLTGRTRRRRWTGVVLGVLALALFGALIKEGMFGGRFDAGRGELHGRFAHFGATGYTEGARVHIDAYGTDHRIESAELFGLLKDAAQRLPVAVEEDSAGEVSSIGYQGRSYAAKPPDWLPLLVVGPLCLLAGTAVWRNAAALRHP